MTIPRLPRALVPALLALLCASCSTQPELEAFSSDGCSMFLDEDWQRGDSWCDCCVQHDYAYWQGGTPEQRSDADLALMRCVEERTGQKELAAAMYAGVRMGGPEIYPTWYRWGYGWPYGANGVVSDELRASELRKKGGVDLQSVSDQVCRSSRSDLGLLLR
jgi:hypothetical protein